MAKLVSKCYSHALFLLAIEENKVDQLFEDVTLFLETLKDGDLLNVILHPQISFNEKVSVLTNTYEGKISDEILSLMAIVIRKNRESDIVNIFNFFIDEVNEYKGVANAKIISAVALDESQVERIVKKLAAELNKKIIAETIVDESLIGGMIIQVGGMVIDGSIKKSINDLKLSLLKIQLA